MGWDLAAGAAVGLGVAAGAAAPALVLVDADAAAGRNASMRSNVISNPKRGSGAIDKSRRPPSAIW